MASVFTLVLVLRQSSENRSSTSFLRKLPQGSYLQEVLGQFQLGRGKSEKALSPIPFPFLAIFFPKKNREPVHRLGNISLSDAVMAAFVLSDTAAGVTENPPFVGQRCSNYCFSAVVNTQVKNNDAHEENP